MGRVYDGIHRITFLIDEQGKIQHVLINSKQANIIRLS